MSKGLEFELDVRAVQEMILDRINKTGKKTGNFLISTEEFYDFSGYDDFGLAIPKLQSNEKLPVILLQIEYRMEGKVSLMSAIPAIRERKGETGRIFKIHDYNMSFNLDNVSNKTKNNKTQLFLSMDGFGKLYCLVEGKQEEYIFRNSTKKRDLLYALIEASHKPVPSKDLMRILELEKNKDLTRLTSQLRNGIKKLRGVNHYAVLPKGNSTEGYKIGDDVEIKIER